MKRKFLKGTALGLCSALCITALPISAFAVNKNVEHAVIERAAAEYMEEKSGSSGEVPYVDGQVLVGFKSNMGEKEITVFVEEHQGRCKRFIPMGDGFMATVELPQNQTVEEAVSFYENCGLTDFAQPNYLYIREKENRIEQNTEETTEKVSRSVNDSYINKQWYFNKVQVYDAWSILDRKNINKVKVAVIDSGCDTTHPDLQVNMNKSLCVDVEEQIKPGGTDSSYIGTGMCGIIGATSNDSIGIAGVAAGNQNNIVDLFSVQVWRTYDLGFTSIFWAVSEDYCAGIQYAIEKGAKVITMSDWITYVDEAFRTKCEEANKKGITLVCGAGQQTEDSDEVYYPAAFDTAISVAACSDFTDPKQEIGGNSNYGKQIDICGPGADMVSTYPLNEPQSDYGKANYQVGYDEWGFSTDMASAVVAGTAAMLYAVNPSLSPNEVKDAIQKTATDLYTPGLDEYTGAGLVNAAKALQYVLPKPTGIQFSPSSMQLKIGETQRANLVLQPVNAEETVAYTSSDPAVASVDAAGNVRGIKEGNAVITASASGLMAKCSVAVGIPIAYVLSGGKNNAANKSYYTGKAMVLKNPVKKGYQFIGWYTDAGKKNKITKITKAASGYTLYAKWKKVGKPKKAAFISVSRISNKKMKVRIKKVSGAAGYQIVYARDKKLKKNKKAVISKKTGITIKGLKQARYYVKVRAYKLDSANQKIYGKYSTAKRV